MIDLDMARKFLRTPKRFLTLCAPGGQEALHRLKLQQVRAGIQLDCLVDVAVRLNDFRVKLFTCLYCIMIVTEISLKSMSCGVALSAHRAGQGFTVGSASVKAHESHQHGHLSDEHALVILFEGFTTESTRGRERPSKQKLLIETLMSSEDFIVCSLKIKQESLGCVAEKFANATSGVKICSKFHIHG
jgi:hypothetical protein